MFTIVSSKKLQYALCLVLVLTMISCSDSTNKESAVDFIQNHKWSRNGKIILSEEGYVSKSKWNDKTKEMDGDTLTKVYVNDSVIKIGMVKPLFRHDDNFNIYEEDYYSYVKDTFIYLDMKYSIVNYNGIKLLLEDSLGEYFALSLVGSDEYNAVEFKRLDPIYIDEYTIGGTINRNEFNVNSSYNFSEFSVEELSPIGNEDLDLSIIHDSVVLSIIYRKVSNAEIGAVREVLDSKIGIEPIYKEPKKSGDYLMEYYLYDHDGISVSLQNSKYIGSDWLKNSVSRDGWNIYYNDYKLGALLKECGVNKPKSRIVK